MKGTKKHVLRFMLVTAPVCHVDTLPLNAVACKNTVAKEKRRANAPHGLEDYKKETTEMKHVKSEMFESF